jgi:hypothetical protein
MIDKKDFEIPLTLHLSLAEAKALIALLYETTPDMATYGQIANKLHEVINKAETITKFDL